MGPSTSLFFQSPKLLESSCGWLPGFTGWRVWGLASPYRDSVLACFWSPGSHAFHCTRYLWLLRLQGPMGWKGCFLSLLSSEDRKSEPFSAREINSCFVRSFSSPCSGVEFRRCQMESKFCLDLSGFSRNTEALGCLSVFFLKTFIWKNWLMRQYGL